MCAKVEKALRMHLPFTPSLCEYVRSKADSGWQSEKELAVWVTEDPTRQGVIVKEAGTKHPENCQVDFSASGGVTEWIRFADLSTEPIPQVRC